MQQLSRWYLAIIVALAGLPSMSFVGHMMTRSETNVGVTRIKVAGGDTQSFETTTYKINSVKETGVSMKIAQQPSSNLGFTEGSGVKTDRCPAEQIGKSNSSLLQQLSRW